MKIEFKYFDTGWVDSRPEHTIQTEIDGDNWSNIIDIAHMAYKDKFGHGLPNSWDFKWKILEQDKGPEKVIYNFIYTNTVTGGKKQARLSQTRPVERPAYATMEQAIEVAAANTFYSKFGKWPVQSSYRLTSYEIISGGGYEVVNIDDDEPMIGDPGDSDSDNPGHIGEAVKNIMDAFGGQSSTDGPKRGQEIYTGDTGSIEFDEVVKPVGYNQGEIDVIEALYQMLPFEQFRGFMKSNIIKYAVRYEHKGKTQDLDKITEYTARLKGYEEAKE